MVITQYEDLVEAQSHASPVAPPGTSHRRGRRARGMTMIEIVAVAVLLVILTLVTISKLGKTTEDAKTDIVYTDQTVFATDIEAVIQEVGTLELSADTGAVSDEVRAKTIREYLLNMQNNYMHAYFNFDTLKVYARGFDIYTKDAADPWGMPYLIKYNTAPGSSISDLSPGDMMIISGGPNMEIETTGYKTLEFSDDKILLVDVKSNEIW